MLGRRKAAPSSPCSPSSRPEGAPGGSARLRAVAALGRGEPCTALRALSEARHAPNGSAACIKGTALLDIYPLTIEIARDAGRAAKVIAQHDPDLARQLRRAATSIPLNVAEASAMIGGNRRQRYATALGSARETIACFDVALAMDYIAALSDKTRRRLTQVVGTLVKVSR